MDLAAQFGPLVQLSLIAALGLLALRRPADPPVRAVAKVRFRR